MDTEHPTDLVNVTEAAAAVGRNKSTVSRYLSDGRLTNRGTDSRPLVSLAEVQALLAAGLDPAKRRKPLAEGVPLLAPVVSPRPAAEGAAPPVQPALSIDSTLAQERIRKTRADADRAEMELAEKQGLLVERQPVEDAGFELGVKLRELLDQRLPALAQKLVGQTDPRAVQIALEEADRKLLAALERAVAELLGEAGVTGAVAA